MPTPPGESAEGVNSLLKAGSPDAKLLIAGMGKQRAQKAD